MTDPADRYAPQEFVVDEHEAGERLDVYLVAKFPEFSRVHVRKIINDVGAMVDGAQAKASLKLKAGQRVSITPGEPPRNRPAPEEIPLDVLYEDDDLAVINKPPGMVVHPAKGHWAGTLASALQFHFDQLSETGGPTRPGIVHRLDRDTSGVILVAKHDRAHVQLAAQFEAREVKKQYFAIVQAELDRDRDVIDKPIGPHPHHREKMAIRHDPTARDAVTFYEAVERFRGFTAVEVKPETGRTHQIRVHLASLGAAVLCDKLYGGRSQITRGELIGPRGEQPTNADEAALDRQALHAQRLQLAHPITGQPLDFSAPIPADIQTVLDLLRTHRA